MRKTLLFVIGFVLFAGRLQAQNQTISGKVADSKGDPIPNASVVIKGTKIGTATDNSGSFKLEAPPKSKTLVISSVGLESTELLIGNKTSFNVTLNATEKSMEEVVVVGYGTKTVRENTGAISKINGAKVAQEPVSSFDQALAGKTAGVQISLGSGMLADRTAIRVRGVNSISSSSQPLVVIDGIPQNDKTANLNGFNTGNGTRFDPLALINPNDIESIEVLKDAGASVIYGSRASNGVILITTKKGKKGSVKVSFDSKFGWANASKLPPLLNGDEFTTITNEKGANRFGDTSVYARMAQNSDVNADGQPDRTNWNDYTYRQGMTYDNSVTLSGGADKISVYGSARYLTQEGITLGNKLKSGQARLNLDITPRTWFKTGVQLAYTKTLNNGVLSDGLIAGTTVAGWQSPPNVSPFNPAGPSGYNLTASGLLGNGSNVTTINGLSYLPSSSYYNNIIPTIKFQRNDNTADEIRANLYGEFTPIRGLKITSKFGLQNISNFEDQYSSPFINGNGSAFNGLVQDQRQQFNQWTWQNYINYDRTFGGSHRIAVVAGTEYQKNSFLSQYTGAANFTTDFFNHIVDKTYTNTNPGTTSLNDLTGGDLRASGLISYFGRLDYSFAGKYYIEGSIRRDGYSGFGEQYQFGNFPSVALGWELTKEQFLQNVSWLDFLKIRGSYGQVGNSRGVTEYAALTLFGGASYTSLNGLGITQAGNPNLKWETAKKTNVGFEATILKNKIGLVVDYFKSDINGLILLAPTLYSAGIPLSSISTNIGGMYNKGIEVTINTTPYSTKDFTWTSSINFTRIKNKVTGLVPSNSNADINIAQNVASVGKPIGTFFLPKWAGVDVQTGNPMWYAKNGTIKRYNFGASGSNLWTDEKGTPVAALGGADYDYIDKGGLPTFYGGWDNSFTYKNFDLNISIVYQGGNLIYNTSKMGMMTNQFSNNFKDILNRWQKPGDVTDVPKLWLNDQSANVVSTRWLEKGDFIRFRTITMGYNFSRAILDKIGIDNIRLYVQAFNPFIITKYTGLDPDVNTSGTSQNTSNTVNSNITLGIDNRATPQSRIFTVGVNFSF